MIIRALSSVILFQPFPNVHACRRLRLKLPENDDTRLHGLKRTSQTMTYRTRDATGVADRKLEPVLRKDDP
jgi:hypothetical protein